MKTRRECPGVEWKSESMKRNHPTKQNKIFGWFQVVWPEISLPIFRPILESSMCFHFPGGLSAVKSDLTGLIPGKILWGQSLASSGWRHLRWRQMSDRMFECQCSIFCSGESSDSVSCKQTCQLSVSSFSERDKYVSKNLPPSPSVCQKKKTFGRSILVSS